MEDIMQATAEEVSLAALPVVAAVGKQELMEFTRVLNRYKGGKQSTEQRIIESEKWWKLRNTAVEAARTDGDPDEFRSKSAWLHNVITSKHADINEAYPRANILPREEGDKEEANRLSKIVPCVLASNGYRLTWDLNAWQKCKSGTGATKVTWDARKLNGLGDISVERVSLLSVYWQPGLADIQQSPYLFHLEAWDKKTLLQTYPQINAQELNQSLLVTDYQLDDVKPTEDEIPVVEVYYHKGGKLHYCQYTGDQVIYATENDEALAEKGLYDHGRYPYVMDPLFPIEGSPCGYGYVDIAKNPQLEIDALKTSIVKSARVCAEPAFLSSNDGSINEAEFCDWTKRIKHVNGGISEATIKQIQFAPLNSVYLAARDSAVQELRETTGNTEAGTGATPSGVTAASAIAALQEASGKGSRDAISRSYIAFNEIVTLVIELIRQFYDAPRQFRITGANGAYEYISYTNAGIRPQPQGMIGGIDQGYRVPAFDVEVSAERNNSYKRAAQNELALQFYHDGFFNPSMAEQALACLEMMDFDGRSELMQRIAKNAAVQEIAAKYMLWAAQTAPPEMQPMIQQDYLRLSGGDAQLPTGPIPAIRQPTEGAGGNESGVTKRARQQSRETTAPRGGSQ